MKQAKKDERIQINCNNAKHLTMQDSTLGDNSISFLLFFSGHALTGITCLPAYPHAHIL